MVYDLVPPKAPHLHGLTLAAATNIVELVGETTGLSQYLCKDSGFHLLRSFEFEEAPTMMPILAPEQLSGAVTDATAVKAADYLEDVRKAANKSKDSKSGDTWRFWTCRDYYRAYTSAKQTPLQIATKLLENIEESDKVSPPLGCMKAYEKTLILNQAQASTARYQEGKPLSIVDGVPVVVKDEVDVEGYETNVGTTFLNKGNPATQDAFIVSKLRAAGAIIIGKSCMHEIGLGVTNINPSSKTPRNPYNPLHCTGGSSGGSGAAVGSGLVPIAIGCDGGGSVRIPASMCGIYGLKPTQGRLSSIGEFPLAPTVAVSGPMCASMEDLAIAYAIMAGKDLKDVNSLVQPDVLLPQVLENPKPRGALEGLRIGIYSQWFDDVVDESVKVACREMLQRLVDEHGATLVEIQIPELYRLSKAHVITIVTEMIGKIEPKDRKKLNHQTRIEMSMVNSLKGSDYFKAQQQRTRCIAHLESIFGRKPGDELHREKYHCKGNDSAVDVIVTPTLAQLPPSITPAALTHGESNYNSANRTMQYMMMANLCGIPAISAVAGYSIPRGAKEGAAPLPIGIQFQAPWWEEKRLIEIGAVCEQILESSKQGRQKPRIWTGNYDL